MPRGTSSCLKDAFLVIDWCECDEMFSKQDRLHDLNTCKCAASKAIILHGDYRRFKIVGLIDGHYEAFRNSQAALIDICTRLTVSITRTRHRKYRRKSAMHHPVQIEGPRSHLASGYVARTDHVTVGPLVTYRYPRLGSIYFEDQQLEDLSCIETFQSPLNFFYHHVCQSHSIIFSDPAHGTARMPFSSLPIEIIQQIADCIENAYRPSLFIFSSASKACHKASAFLIFRRINVTVHCRATLKSEMDRLVEALSRAESARYVQCITIKGDIRPRPKSEDEPGLEWLQSTGLNEILPDLGPPSQSRHYVVYDEPVIKKSSKEDLSWAPVLSLIQVIPHLKDLIYDCKSQLPPSLLSTLHKQHPQCRLHHLSFRFRTLLWDVPYPYGMELATSPSLYKVKLICTYRDSDYDDDFNEEAIMDLVAGLAPNLKEIINVNIMAYRSGRDYRRKESWHGLPGSRDGTKGSLTSLTLIGASLSSPEKLQSWATRTDFTFLQYLNLGLSYDFSSNALSGETMKWLAQNHSFPRLRTLKVSLNRDHVFQDRPHYSVDAVSFFQALEPLEQLSVHGPIDSQIVDAILSRHGKTLQKLSLRPLESPYTYGNGRDPQEIPMEFAMEHLFQIQVRCPILEDLSITIKRDMSSLSEASMYRVFGKMKSLRFLFLTLDCSNWQISRDPEYSSQFEGQDQQPVDEMDCRLKRGHWRQTLINCAVDEALARSIWNTINQDKTGTQLERLRLWTTGGSESHAITASHATILKNLSRSWLIERDPRDDRNDFTIRELGKHARKLEYQFTESELTGFAGGQVFRAIWPRREGSKDWRDDWSSFPL